MILRYSKRVSLQVWIDDSNNNRKRYKNYQGRLMRKINMLIKNLKFWIYACNKVVKFYKMLLHYVKEYPKKYKFKIKILTLYV